MATSVKVHYRQNCDKSKKKKKLCIVVGYKLICIRHHFLYYKYKSCCRYRLVTTLIRVSIRNTREIMNFASVEQRTSNCILKKNLPNSIPQSLNLFSLYASIILEMDLFRAHPIHWQIDIISRYRTITDISVMAKNVLDMHGY